MATFDGATNWASLAPVFSAICHVGLVDVPQHRRGPLITASGVHTFTATQARGAGESCAAVGSPAEACGG